MKKIRSAVIIILALFSSMSVFSQGKMVLNGRVLDASDKSPIIGATVKETDQDDRVVNGTITDVSGNFILQMKDPDNNVSVSFIGYSSYEIKDKTRETHIIELQPEAMEMEEVVVTAQRKNNYSLTNIDDRDKASSTVKVDLSDTHDLGVTSAADALQGKVTGLDIISGSGDPGSGSQIVIRGLSSMGNNRPLIVIDGIPQQRVSQDFDLTSADTEDISNLINIALQDIKSIEVLKDAASTAVYGSKGADGVLLIETFRGRMGQVQFNYQYKNSINFQPPPIPMLNGDEYSILQLEEWHNAIGKFEVPPEIAYDRDFADFYNYSANTDWIGSITQNSVTHDHYFKISGGGEKTRYFTSFSYVDEGGTTINTSSRRFSTRTNLDYFLSRKFLFTIQFNYTNNTRKQNIGLPTPLKRGKMNIREMAYIKAPNMSIWEYNEEGNLTGDFFNPINSYQGPGSAYFNPYAVAVLGSDNDLINSLENTFKVRYNITDWLTFRETVSFQYRGTKTNAFLPYSALGADWLYYMVNQGQEVNNINSAINTETQIAFDVPIKNTKHIVSGTVNWITQSSNSEAMNIQVNKTPSTDITDPASDSHIGWMGTFSNEKRELGILGNLNYKYNDKYLIQTILRADAASSFGSANRWGLFKGVSIGWRFSEETFLNSYAWLGESMLRASWGVSGRQPGDPYARFATYASTYTGSYIDYTAIVPTQIQLNMLQWETISSYDVGLELNLFKDKLYMELGYYEKITEDILFKDYDIPLSSGFDELNFFNGGEMKNKGYEIMTDIRLISMDNFTWSLNFNASRNVNSFSKLPENFNTEKDLSIGNGEFPKKVVEGEPIGSFFGFRYLGVWATDEDVVAKDADGNILHDGDGIPIPLTYAGSYIFKGGDAKYEDINHDGTIDLNDVVFIGDSNPDFIGGFGTYLRYKNLNISMSFNYRTGFDIVNRVAINTQGMSNRNNQSTAVLHRWRVQGQNEPGMLPRAYLNHPANNLGSDRYVEPGDFLRLNNVKLGYRLPNTFLKKIGLRSADLSLSARKLLTFTNYTGQDPEVSQDATDPFWIGEDDAKTPPPRMVTVSFSVGF